MDKVMNPAFREALNIGAAVATVVAVYIIMYNWPAIYHWFRGKRSEPDDYFDSDERTYDPTLDSWDENERPGNW